MTDKRQDRYKKLINDYCDGKATIQGDHPKEVMTAMDTFFHMGKILMDNPELTTIPPEYVNKLLTALSKYPQYRELLLDLIAILKRHETP